MGALALFCGAISATAGWHWRFRWHRSVRRRVDRTVSPRHGIRVPLPDARDLWVLRTECAHGNGPAGVLGPAQVGRATRCRRRSLGSESEISRLRSSPRTSCPSRARRWPKLCCFFSSPTLRDWYFFNSYAKTWQGLVDCYVAASRFSAAARSWQTSSARSCCSAVIISCNTTSSSSRKRSAA